MADEFDFPILTFAEIKKLKVVDLKARLTDLGLPVSGLKADLVARLASFLESRAIQAAFDEANDQEESEPADDGGSTDVLEQPGITRDKGVLVETHGKDEGSDESQPDELGGPSHVPDDVPEQVSVVVSQVATKVSANKEDGDAPMHMNESVDVVEPSVESVGDVVEHIIDIDNEKDVQKDAMQVEQTMEDKESTAIVDEKKQQTEEKVPEIQQEDIEIQEKREVEIHPDRGMDSPPDEVGVVVQPEETRIEPDHIDSKETEQTMEQQTLEPVEEQIMVQQHQVEKAEEIAGSVEADQPQPIDVDQSETQEDILVEAEQSVSGSAAIGQEISEADDSVTSVEDMETETTEGDVSEDSTQGAPQESAASAETNEVVEDKQSQSSPEEPLHPPFESPKETPSLEPHLTSPSLHPPVQAPTLPPTQPPTLPPTQPPTLPPTQPPTLPPTQPPTLPPTQPPTLPPTQPPFAPPTHLQSQQMHKTPSPQAPALPPNLQSPSHQISQILSHSPSEDAKEVEPTPPDKTSTPPRGAVPHIEPPPRDASPREPTPQEDIPLKVTPPRGAPPKPSPSSPRDTLPPPPDPLAEAKAKARSIVEMRERRLNEESQSGTRGDDSGYDVDHYEREGIPTASRQEKKKKKKKKRKKRRNVQTNVLSETETAPDDEGIEVEYVPETLDVKDPVYALFASIFETFKLSEEPETTKKDEAKDKPEDKTTEAAKKDDDDEMDTDSEEEETQKEEKPGEKGEKLSKKKLKLKNRMSVAELKQTVHRPDVVEMHDVTAPDPKLLVYLKACRNTVPVPRHWCFKRKFLQGKRGIIKPPFQLPEFIQKTGIMEMREALQEKEDAKNMKAKMREKIRPKMGKIDIDYQKLHDAFFKWQTKPKMSIHGDLYYEGKEFETKLKEKKPGDLSEDLRTALGMPTGQGSNLVPPPWLIAMQRYGPPPSYPNLKIRGLNAPIPEGASFGYHAGGWGKPPVDEHGRPLYGDVFGVQQTDMNIVDDELVDSNMWGELESESEESEESEEESEEEAPDQSGLVTPAETGLVTPSGLTSIPAGMETPDMIELRKRKNIEDAMESGSEQPSLYTVLPEKRAGVGGMMMGSSHVYDLATAAAPTGTRKTPGGLSEGVEVALDPSELELDPAAMQARYDEQLREQQSTQKEDFSDMVAEHAARQQKKRKKTTESGKAAKKYKEFKF